MRVEVGRFQDEDPAELELEPSDSGPDFSYDLWVEDQIERHCWPEGRDRFLRRISTGAEPELEYRRRVA